MAREYVAQSSDAGQKVYDALVGRFPDLPSRKSLKKALSRGEILIDGVEAKWDDKLSNGQRVSYTPKIRDQEGITLDKPLEVLYEDEDLAVVNKPAGILVNGTHPKTIEKALTTYLKIANYYAPRPVHRLDRSTSGCLLVAKTAVAAERLGKSFETREVDKTYLAIAIGEVPIGGEINLPVDGKWSSSSWKRVDLVSSDKVKHLSLLEVSISTGRRHQIRKHLSQMGHPIIGDNDYGPSDGQFGQGLYLHAWKLSFPHPLSRTVVNVAAPIPAKFGRIFDSPKSVE